MVNVAAIFSTLGNPNSLIPLAVKDMSSTAGVTAGSFITGKEEGEDRFIDEIGTQILWLCGIPAFKKLFDKTIFKAYDLDAEFDVRNLKNKDIFKKIKEYAPTDNIKKNLEKIGKKQGAFKNLALYKFFFATGATIVSYIGLTKAKHKITENRIKKNLIKEYNSKKDNETNKNKTTNNLSFKGAGEIVKNFAFSPVKNMWILDGAITGERLWDSRSPQEFTGYGIREGLYLFFMYYLGNKIQEGMEKRADNKFGKSIALDARVLEDKNLQKIFKDGSVKESLNSFDKAKKMSDAELYEFLHKNPENDVVKIAKQSDLISMYKKTDKIDTRKYIDLEKVKNVHTNLEKLYKQYLSAISKGETNEEFFAKLKNLKRGSVLTNICTCVFALGFVIPAAMVAKRLCGKDNTEFQTKKEIREQLIKEGIIV